MKQTIEQIFRLTKQTLLERLPAPVSGFEPQITRTPKPELGDLAVAAFPLSKPLRRSPQEIAKDWAARLEPGTELAPGLRLERAETAGGFLNLRLDQESLMRTVCAAVAEEREDYAGLTSGADERVMIEYSAPNTNKPLHLGHVRNNAIGMSVTNLLAAGGHQVIPVNLVNDRGIHISKSMVAYRRWAGGETPESTGEKGDHFVGRYYVRFDQALREERAEFLAREEIDPKRLDREEQDRAEERFLASSPLMAEAKEMLRLWEEGDDATRRLWETMNGWVYDGFDQTYDRLGCRFDRWYYESETWKVGRDEVERGLREGIFFRKEDGSIWANLGADGLGDKLLLRSDGTSVYITQDIGTAIKKYEDFKMDRSLHVVGQEQVLHFKNLFAILRRLGHPWADGCRHLSYGLITLPRGMGRLKSREGTKVDADDLLDLLHEEARQRIVAGGYCGEDEGRIEATAEAIAQGALKVYLLQVSNEKNIVFDPQERLAFEGDTGPAIQYSHARICGIVRKGIERDLIAAEDLIPARDAGSGVYAAVRPDRVDYAKLTSAEERDLILRILELPLVLTTGCRQISAAPIANYLLDLTRSYARFYHEHRVLDAPDAETRTARLQLSLCVAQVLRRGLAILTVQAPDRM